MKKCWLAYFVLLAVQLNAQQKISLQFSASFGSENLRLYKNYYSSAHKDSFSFSTLKYYIGKITFYQNAKKIFSLNKYFLIDVSADSAISLQLPKNLKYNSISFSLGVDSVTNAKPSFKESLDPRKGMYWAWHSGYINFKLEGKSPLCNSVNNVFQFHLGGFLNNQLAVKEVKFTTKKAPTHSINFDVEKFINNIDFKTTSLIMTPGKQSVQLSKAAAACFFVAN